MEAYPFPPEKVLIIGNIEYLIDKFGDNPEFKFKAILQLIDKYKIAEHKETMTYFYELLSRKRFIEYADEFAKKYNLQITKD